MLINLLSIMGGDKMSLNIFLIIVGSLGAIIVVLWLMNRKLSNKVDALEEKVLILKAKSENLHKFIEEDKRHVEKLIADKEMEIKLISTPTPANLDEAKKMIKETLDEIMKKHTHKIRR